MNETRFDFVKDEIRFFMEKSFQVSFGYIGALIAIVATVKLDALDALARQLGMTTGLVVSVLILAMNGLYLTIAIACLFAILKRGYFILDNAPSATTAESDLHSKWETYVRSYSKDLFALRPLNHVAWNLDNYFMLPIFVLIMLVSVAAAFYPWVVESCLWFRLATLILLLANLTVLGFGTAATGRLDRLCRDELEKPTGDHT